MKKENQIWLPCVKCLRIRTHGGTWLYREDSKLEKATREASLLHRGLGDKTVSRTGNAFDWLSAPQKVKEKRQSQHSLIGVSPN